MAHKGWYAAVDLRAGDILVLVNGEYVTLEKTQHEILEAPITVYNFEVEDYHAYYVGSDGVLVHNACQFRKALQKETGSSGAGMEAHHVFPQKFKEEFRGIDINNGLGKYGAWVNPKSHRKFSAAYNKAWKQFFSGTPTKKGAYALARSLAKKYGYSLNF